MKIGLVSDIHMEFRHQYELEFLRDRFIQEIGAERPDLVLDLGDGSDASTIGRRTDFWKEVQEKSPCNYAYVHGNHDYYGGSFFGSEFSADVYSITGEEHFTLHCATLWTNFRDDPLAEIVAKAQIMDFHAIKVQPSGRKLEPSDVKAEFAYAINQIDKIKAPVVATHFPPSTMSTHPRFITEQNTLINKYFVNSLEEFILDRPHIKLWMHGHVHDPFDYRLGQCRVVCNPLGYPTERSVLKYHMKFVEVE